MRPFILVKDLFPGRSARWVADSCRAGRIPGATKVGASWFVQEQTPSVVMDAEQAAYEDLRCRGIFA